MPRPSQQEIIRSQMPKDVVLNSARRGSSTYFNKSLYPPTYNCQVLDAQISKLRDDKDLVYRGKMSGSRRDVKDFLMAKELQFERQNCSQILEDSSVKGTIDMTQDEFKKAEERIIAEANKKRQTMLIVGGGVLLLGLAIFIK